MGSRRGPVTVRFDGETADAGDGKFDQCLECGIGGGVLGAESPGSQCERELTKLEVCKERRFTRDDYEIDAV